jgi:hypothetical protein
MRKTGEAYTAARAQLLKKAAAAPALAPKVAYAKLAGMSDAKVKEATGCDWERWVHALDRHKAYELTHTELAKLVKAKYRTPAWWTQTVAVGYERIKGLRARGQARDGSFAATKSRTFDVPIDTLFEAWNNASTRAKWLAVKNLKVRKATPPKSIRLEQDGAVIVAMFSRRPRSKSAVAIEESKLPSREAAQAVKDYWSGRFDDLAMILSEATPSRGS